MADRAEKKIVNERIELIERFRIRGMRFTEIKQTIEKLNESPDFVNKFIVNDRMLRRYMQLADNNIKEAALPRRKFFFQQSLRRYDDLYNKCIKLNDLKGAAAINEKRDRLLGLMDMDY